jgi:2-C-methyl-D-erythritol 4-phosphate cytidylyltransferase
MIDRVFNEALGCGAALLAAPLTGTVKRVSVGGVVQETVSRAGLYEAQTPQVFKKDLLVDAYQAVEGDTQATDDADVVALSGHDVRIVECDMSNMKITYPGDLKLAGAINKGRPKPKPTGPRGPFDEAQW